MALTVNQLIEALKQLKDDGLGDTEVMTSYNYGDHWRTQVADGVDSADIMEVVYSDYLQMHKIVEQDEDDQPRTDVRAVVVLN